MLILKEWSLQEAFMGGAHGSGIVYGHHRLQDGHHITTSAILEIYDLPEKDMYVAKTYSGSVYQLYKSEMVEECKEKTLRLIHEIMEQSTESEENVEMQLEQAEAARIQKRALRESSIAAMKKQLQDGELYLLMESDHTELALFCAGGEVYEIPRRIHSGMFQDSVLVTDWQKEKVDFRYFPKWDIMEPYHWSDGLKCIYIQNFAERTLTFKGTDKEILCKTGKIVKIEKDVYRGEGLFSPDAVNGKSVFSK